MFDPIARLFQDVMIRLMRHVNNIDSEASNVLRVFKDLADKHMPLIIPYAVFIQVIFNVSNIVIVPLSAESIQFDQLSQSR